LLRHNYFYPTDYISDLARGGSGATRPRRSLGSHQHTLFNHL